MEFIFDNWPDTGRGLRVAMRRLVDDGRSYQEAVDLAKRSYLHAVLLKMPGAPVQKIVRRCGMSRGNLIYLIKKYQLGAVYNGLTSTVAIAGHASDRST